MSDVDDAHRCQMLNKENKMLQDLRAQLASLEYETEFRRRIEAQRRKEQSGASLLDSARRQAGITKKAKKQRGN